MQYKITAPISPIKGKIKLPASKSISNRVLIINALSYSPFPIHNLSDSNDTKVMLDVLNSNTNQFDVGAAGTAMRFLTAYLSKIVGQWEITGTERMKQRPIGILVDALNNLGAKIEYIEKEGYPPLRIWGSRFKGKTIELDGSVSSQFITALLLIAPYVEEGLTIKLKNKVTSASYIRLTLNLMEKFGVHSNWEKNEVRIEEQNYLPIDYTVEGDWSGASYLYQLVALSEGAELEVDGLQLPSLQGDAAIANWFEEFGIVTNPVGSGLKLLNPLAKSPKNLTLNFVENPDVAQTMATLCVAKKVSFHFSGLETLKIKETDRIKALQDELAKFGAQIVEPQHGELKWDGQLEDIEHESAPTIATYKDHRMALAFAPMALTGTPVIIDDPMVVTKSYPSFWKDLSNLGFTIEKLTG